MENVNFWKILRVLTTDTCNFDCVFCHNEGQEKPAEKYLSLDDLISVIKAVGDKLKEIQFSGGEPFLNSETIRMIEWIDQNTDLEIGCATNMSVVDTELITRLSKTRVSLNIQFPHHKNARYRKVTQYYGDNDIIEKLKVLRAKGVSFNLNYVWLKEDIEILSEMLDFCEEYTYDLKILPYISDKTITKNNFRKLALETLIRRYGKETKKKGGAFRWEYYSRGRRNLVKYIDSPCFKGDFETCKEYSEIRLLPDLRFQTCLFKNTDTHKIDVFNHEHTIQTMKELWDNFISC